MAVTSSAPAERSISRLWKALSLGCALLVASAAPFPCRANETMSFVYHLDDTGRDVRNHYLWRIMRQSLERTRDEFGDYELKSAHMMREQGRIYVLEHGFGGINVSVIPDQPGLDQKVIRVPIPADSGILGYRVMLIREGEQARFDRIRTAADLQGIRFGLLESWTSTEIMRAAGLEVVAGTSYEGLFQMLAAGRFDAFDRSIVEIIPEYDVRSKELPGLVIERHLVLRYPMPVYFCFPKSEDGQRRADRLALGLSRMTADGSLKAIFDEELGPYFKRLDLAHRRVIELPNKLTTAPANSGDTIR